VEDREEWSPVVPIKTNSGMRWGLNEEEFLRWWNAVPFEDHQSFKVNGGDDSLARFVCVYDWLYNSRGISPSPNAIIEAYSVAVRGDKYDIAVQRRAGQAWEHDAVQDLLDRINSRGERQARNRVVLGYTQLLEGMLKKANAPETDMPVDDQTKIANAVVKYLTYIKKDEQFDRTLRSRKGYAKALEKIEGDSDFDAPKDQELKHFVRQLGKQFGKEQIMQILAEVAGDEKRLAAGVDE
jgi:hypothetical protein